MPATGFGTPPARSGRTAGRRARATDKLDLECVCSDSEPPRVVARPQAPRRRRPRQREKQQDYHPGCRPRVIALRARPKPRRHHSSQTMRVACTCTRGSWVENTPRSSRARRAAAACVGIRIPRCPGWRGRRRAPAGAGQPACDRHPLLLAAESSFGRRAPSSPSPSSASTCCARARGSLSAHALAVEHSNSTFSAAVSTGTRL